MTDWADEKALEWYQGGQEDFRYEGPLDGSGFASLAALLREVAGVGNMVKAEVKEYTDQARKDTLAEVRKIVEEERDRWAAFHNVAPSVAVEILRRLEEL